MNKNIKTFDEWAILNKDEGMEKGHHASVAHMLEMLKTKYTQKYSVIDFGCGNGWVIRRFKNDSLCKSAHGLDGSIAMINKAIAADPEGAYFNEDINIWKPQQKYDIVFSMETLYYFENPGLILNKIYDDVLDENGMIIIGIDHYAENIPSLDWGEKFNLDITTLSIENWITLFESAGFNNIEYQQVEAHKDWQGTLIITAYKNL